MITRNSWTECREILLETLDSTLQIPYRSFILVDDGNDGTSDIITKWCREHDKEVIVTRSRLYGFRKPTRATARQTTIDMFLESFSNKWLMFVDDDAVLNNGWWEEALPHMEDPRVGLIWGLNYDATPFRRKMLEALGIDYVGYLRKQFEIRGGAHDTMVRREAIEDIMIPPELHIFEDAYIKHWVDCKGFEHRILLTGVHHKNPGRNPGKETLKLMAKWGLKLGLEDTRYRNPIFGLYALARTTAGTPLTVLSYIRLNRLKGIPEGLHRAETKWLYRLYLWLYSLKIKPPVNRCEALRRYNAENCARCRRRD